MLLIGNINMMLHDFNSYSKLETRLRLYRSPDFPFPVCVQWSATSGAGTANPSGAPESTHGF
jgi:hypothetical protein